MDVSSFDILDVQDRVLTIRHIKKNGETHETIKKQSDDALHIFFEQ